MIKTINGIDVTFTPYYEITPGPQGAPSEFQSSPGVGASETIIISFSKPVKDVYITSYGANFTGGQILTLDDKNKPLQQDLFLVDSNISRGAWKSKTHSFLNDTNKISRIALIPAEGDYIAFGQFSFTTEEAPATGPIQIEDVRLIFPIKIEVKKAPPVFPPESFIGNFTLNILPIELPIKQAFMDKFYSLATSKIDSFFDDDRVLKTVLNFGNDYQALVTNWTYDPDDSTRTTILFKLYNPLPRAVPIKTKAWVSRELAPPLIDQIFFIYVPGEGIKIYLRPPNKSIKINNFSGLTIDNVTEENLYSTGAFDLVNPTDQIIQEWFVNTIENAELNIDYADYTNFIWFSSAEKRLIAFKNKLALVEDYNRILTNNSSSLAGTGSAHITGTLAYTTIQKIADDRNSIIKSFDGYERFLYYNSGSSYSSSFSKQSDDEFYYVSDCTWPKISGSIAPIASASTWYTTQIAIAQAYDKWNVNYFVNNIPEYLKNDTESEEFIQFLSMVGHQFDVIKTYIDGMSLIYNRENDPTKKLSPDIVWNVAKGFGLDLPNQYALKTLSDYTIGPTSTKIFRQFAAETWKRFLHNHTYFTKIKGTKEALRTLLNVYGILPTTLRIKETSTTTNLHTSHSYETIDEYSTVLNVSASRIDIPWSSSLLNRKQIQIRFSTTAKTEQTLLQFGNNWALTIKPISSSYGRICLETGSNVTVLSSSVLTNLTDGTFYSIQIQSGSAGITLKVYRAYEADIIESSSVSDTNAVPSVWSTPVSMSVGGRNSTYGELFTGYVDEVRIWGEESTEDVFQTWVKYPGLYSGNTNSSAYNYLWTRLSFNKPKNLGTSSISDRFVLNESPWLLNNGESSGSQAIMTRFSASGFTDSQTYPYSYALVERNVVRYSPIGGGTQYDDNKVVIMNEPILSYISGSTVPALRRDRSIVTVDDKSNFYSKGNNIVGFFFSPTDTINDSIIRSMGNINLSDYIGDPADVYRDKYAALNELNKIYWRYYAYQLNQNQFIDFLQNLLGPVFEQAEKLVPARAKLLSGIVIEPTILERNKAKNSRPAIDTDITLEALTGSFKPSTILGENLLLETIYDTEIVSDITAMMPQYSASITNDIIVDQTAEISSYEKSIDITSEYLLESDYPTLEDTIYLEEEYREPAKNTINNTLPQSGTYAENQYIMPVISPYCDLGYDLGASEYFTHQSGYIGTEGITYIKTKQNILRDMGTWVAGASYQQYDYVIDSLTETEFFVHNNTSFISNLAPSLDQQHWRPVAYIPTSTVVPKKVAIISGSLSLVSTDSSLPFPIGYRANHYFFNRDYRLGIIRHQYLGCVQDNNTTNDGKPPVEIFPSAGDTLFVNSTTEPVQPTQNQGGPILDVR